MFTKKKTYKGVVPANPKTPSPKMAGKTTSKPNPFKKGLDAKKKVTKKDTKKAGY